ERWIMKTSEVIFSIEWYVKSKNLALKNALAIRCPMSLDTQEEHRQYYSQYLSSVLSITELLCDKATPLRSEFRDKLYSELGGEHIDGSKYYDYLRELRNSVVHRGMNLTDSMHIVNDFPLILAPNPVTNRNGNQVHEAPEKYFLSIIEHVETVVPALVINHIEDSGWHSIFICNEQAQEESKRKVEQSEAMPDWVKQEALRVIPDIDMLDMQKQRMKSALENIRTTVALPKIA
ncbi:TPA: hypothetical protein I7674_21965, partial [Vibrio vulnificus]|nr:hypothetical protein [Vibrio vulnificus]